MAFLNDGLSSTESLRACSSSENAFGSFTQAGIRPQRTSANCRLPSNSRTIGIGCVGATL